MIQLPIPYFHIVFTTDHGLNSLFRHNQRAMYDLLFQTTSEVLQTKAKEALGCELGITAVLHTWGQQMEGHYCQSTFLIGVAEAPPVGKSRRSGNHVAARGQRLEAVAINDCFGFFVGVDQTE